jgi:CSLREA domain-containing protein
MRSPTFRRLRTRALSLVSFCLIVIAAGSWWATSQRAGNLSVHSRLNNISMGASLFDKGRITPQAVTILVNSTSDVANASDGLCTLREAITAANTNSASGIVTGECAAGSSSGSDAITFGVTGTINLTAPLPNLASNVTITGPGSSQLTVNRNSGGDYRILSTTSGTIVVSGLTITNGKAPDGGNNQPGTDGGGILNSTTLTLTDVIVTANRAGNGGFDLAGSRGGQGGGIFNGGTLTITNCAVTANFAGNGSNTGVSGLGGHGGGIYSSGPLTVTNSDMSSNTTGAGNGISPSGSGGGIYSSSSLTLTSVTINNNSVGAASPGGVGGDGGGIYISGNTSSSLTNCTVSGNHTGLPAGGTSGVGGGVGISGATVSISNSTISNNTSASGAIAIPGGTVIINNSTISGNHSNGAAINSTFNNSLLLLNNCTVALNDSSGIDSPNPNLAHIRNTIVASNNAAGSSDLTGGVVSLGHNLIGKSDGTNSVSNGVNGDQVGTSGSPIDPHLSALANNGGPTQTHALLSNSTAIDAGDDCVTQAAHCGDSNISQLLTDQRGSGFSRIVDGPDADSKATVDIGAYETQAVLANLPDTSTNEDTQLLVTFDGGDTSTISSVTATSGNATVVPNDTAHLSVAMTGSTGVVTINPATNQNGTANITVTINRTGGPDSKTFALTVTAVNDAPTFTGGPAQTVNEDSGAQTVNNWATNVSAGGGADESGQTLTFQVTGNTNASLFSAGPAIAADGTLSYTPAPDANGSATITINLKDNGGTTNGGVDTSASQSFTITVNSVNDPPSFTRGADQTVNEDAGAQTVTNWATGISAGPANESAQTVTFQVTNNTNATLFSAAPAISQTGTLTYTPAANANGSATITINLKDNGGTANGGSDTSTAQTFTITVNAVNDGPSFTKGANQTVNEDAGAQTVTNWATAISPGPANESSQVLTFQVTGNTNTGLFSAGPAISSTGTLTYTPAANANGSATITINLRDDGGTANGGVDTSASQTFTITVNAVNDVPSFTKGADQTVYNTAGAQTVANWATGISPGPANESGQTVTFQVTGNTNAGLFTNGPAISSTGTLTYTPSNTAGGTATITILARDNGGTANGGVDTSAAQSFTITVNPAGGFISFASSSANTTENSGSITINVTRTGDTVLPATVKYATNADAGLPCSAVTGVASPKCDFTAALGTLNFGIGETSKTITILIGQDSFVEGTEVITVTLSSPTGGAALGIPASTSVTIADDASEPPTNIIDDPNQFVRMHYHDFLNREADQSGLNFWVGQMTNCGASDLTVCKVNVSGSFFQSIEFQQTGYLVERMYKTAYGDATGTSTLGGAHSIFVPVVRANEFLADTQRVGQGVVVLQPGWEQVLENNKQAYAKEFVATTRFTTAFPTTMTPAQFVDKLNQNAGNVLSQSERTTALNLFGNSADTTNVTARAQALRQVAEDQDLFNAESNRAFVLAQYFGYLRRNPNDLPDSDYTGYDFWLQKLIQFNGDYVAAEMVKAFISAGEYRQRFGP